MAASEDNSAGSVPSLEPLLTLHLQSDEDLTLAQRRTCQIAGLVGFNSAQSTQLGTAASEIALNALQHAGGGKLEFFLEGQASRMLAIRIQDQGPGMGDQAAASEEGFGIRMARSLVDELQIESSPSLGTTVVLRNSLPAQSPPVAPELIREVVATEVPKRLLAQLHELRRIQREFILNELSLRQRIRQTALLAEVSAAIGGTESVAERLRRCAEEVIAHLDIACAVIWIACSGDEGLELVASAGIACDSLPERPDSQIALIAQQRKPLAWDSLPDYLRTADWEWAYREGLVAFAGYPLASEDRLLGVLAVYAAQPLTADALDSLRLVSSEISTGMDRERRLQERERLLASEREARLKAERATEARDKLLAVVSHDLRNPLSSIVTAAALLARAQGSSEDPRVRKHLETILHSAERMKRLISDLLDLASMEAGHLAFQLAQQPVAPLVSEVVQLHAPIAEAKSIRLDAKADDFLPEIRCDRGRILQVLSNLLGNAIKFTPEGGAISVRALPGGSDVIFAVTDTGPGISDADQTHVFESYWQADPGTGRGLGLGLSIAKGLVESHGGKIWIESRIGHGSTFFISLPAHVGLTRTEDRIAG